jgi:hypothetical protein
MLAIMTTQRDAVKFWGYWGQIPIDSLFAINQIASLAYSARAIA